MIEEPRLGIDRDRIRIILREGYEACQELLATQFDITVDEFVAKIDPHLESNRISTPVQVYLPSKNYPELFIEVDLRRKKLIARMSNKKKQVLLNRYLTVL